MSEAGGELFVGRPLNLNTGRPIFSLPVYAHGDLILYDFYLRGRPLNTMDQTGKYNYEYIQYTIHILRRCKDFGFWVFMDPHQDIWSRFIGGSGALFWALPTCGFNPPTYYGNPSRPLTFQTTRAQRYPPMVWSTSQTLWTLFFAGRDYAP
ncbi:hypothetical protein RSAG8_11495, partial [Rhizoctonia solani AG-8 WAC10335]